MAKERTQQQREALLRARAEHASDRARCDRNRVRLDRRELSTHFLTAAQAHREISARLGPSTLEVVRCDR